MKKLMVLIIVSFLLLTGCKEKVEDANRFADSEMQKIYTFQDSRDSEGLKNYLHNKVEKYRVAAVEAIASVQDKNLLPDLGKVLVEDGAANVRKSAAYAIGQCGNEEGEALLIVALDKEKDTGVRTEILTAIGKCGTDKGLAVLAGNSSAADEEGVVKGIYRYCLRRICSAEGTKRVVNALKSKVDNVREYCGFYFARTNDKELDQYGGDIIAAFDKEKNPVVRMNIALLTGRLGKENALNLLGKAYGDMDYRVRNNGLNSVRRMEGPEFTEYMFKGLADKNIHVQVSASALMNSRGDSVLDKCRESLKNDKLFWRVRVNLLKALLKSEKDKEDAVGKIKIAIDKAVDNYEKAAFIALLGSDAGSYDLLKKIVNSKDKSVVRMAALEALISLRKDISIFKDREKALEFVEFLKNVIKENDPALVTLSCSVLSNKKFNHKEIVKDTAFLKEALVRAEPRTHLEAKAAIEKTLKYFDPAYEIKKDKYKTEDGIDWSYVAGIKKKQIAVVKTNKGDIHIELMVDRSPGSVANFLKLVDSGYYKNNFFHRVVPNFVIQCGCNRGDGWGGPDYTIRSELSNIGYREGYVGMASAGKDTEGSQWFITHSPTPHLDGRYTIFGKVVKGLDVVHKVRRGDKISEIIKVK